MLISPDEINKSLSAHQWQYSKNAIHKSYMFGTYMKGVNFVNKIVKLSERNNHHPDIYITWCKVTISITSHDLGGVTTKCVNLANSIDGIT